MRVVRNATAAAAMLLLGFAGAAKADDKQDIAALYAKLDKAVVAKDLKTIMATGAPGFTYTEAGHTMSGDQVSAQMQQQFQATTGTPKSKTTVTSVVVKGTTAVVGSIGVTELQMVLPDGKPHKLSSTSKTSDTLTKTAKGWLFQKINILSNKMTLDGKPFDPSKPPAGK